MTENSMLIDEFLRGTPWFEEEPPGATPTTEGVLDQWPAEWLVDALASIEKLALLPENWDSYGAREANERSLQISREFVSQLARITKTRPEITLSPSGWVMFSWENEAEATSLEFYSDGLVAISHVDFASPSTDFDHDVPLYEIYRYLDLIPGT